MTQDCFEFGKNCDYFSPLIDEPSVRSSAFGNASGMALAKFASP